MTHKIETWIAEVELARTQEQTQYVQRHLTQLHTELAKHNQALEKNMEDIKQPPISQFFSRHVEFNRITREYKMIRAALDIINAHFNNKENIRAGLRPDILTSSAKQEVERLFIKLECTKNYYTHWRDDKIIGDRTTETLIEQVLALKNLTIMATELEKVEGCYKT